MSERDDLVLNRILSSEAGEVESIARAIWPAVYTDIISSDQIDYMLQWMYAPEKIRIEIEDEAISWFWIESGERRIGFIAGGPLSADRDFPLHKIYLLPECHGSGFGSRAINAFFKYVDEEGGQQISLRVNRDNTAALNFYKKNGFQLTGMNQADIGNGFFMDDCLLTKTL